MLVNTILAGDPAFRKKSEEKIASGTVILGTLDHIVSC